MEFKSKYSHTEYFLVLCLLFWYISSLFYFKPRHAVPAPADVVTQSCSVFYRIRATRAPCTALDTAASWDLSLHSDMAGAAGTSFPGNPQRLPDWALRAFPWPHLYYSWFLLA